MFAHLQFRGLLEDGVYEMIEQSEIRSIPALGYISCEAAWKSVLVSNTLSPPTGERRCCPPLVKVLKKERDQT
jgi:hypothetical protein